jgi:hypothetical protein
VRNRVVAEMCVDVPFAFDFAVHKSADPLNNARLEPMWYTR